MKISRRRYEKKMAVVRWQALGEGQERGRQEMADMSCSWLGKVRRGVTNNGAAYKALLHAQAYAEGQRLLAYFYDETATEGAVSFSQRFYDSRIAVETVELFPNISQANYSELKAAYSGAILFFRVSGNYAIYNDDANFVMELFGINQPSTLADWLDKKVPVLHFKSGEVPGYIHGVTETGRAVAFAEPLINAEAEVLHVTKSINREAA